MPAPEPRHPRFKAGDEILNGRYTIVHKDGSKEPPGPAEPVDTGGAGTVYRVTYKDFRDRALKILTMQSRSEDPDKKTVDYQATFTKEQRLLKLLSHGNIVQLHDCGSDLKHLHDDRDNPKDEDTPWEYHVTEWIGGETLLQEMKSSSTTGRQCYTLISEVLQAVKYMHKLKFAHGDIKYDNIRCRHLPDETLQAVLLDFGSAQLFGESAEDAPAFLGSDAMTTLPEDAAGDPAQLLKYSPFATTEKLLHPKLKDYHNEPVTTSNCNLIFPLHDIFSIGVLFQDLLNEFVVRLKLETELGAHGIRGMELMIDRLKNPSLTGRHYNEVEHVHRDWEKLRSDYTASAGVPELGVAAESKYSIPTPMGRVAITRRLNYFTSHKLFGYIDDMLQLEMLHPSLLGSIHPRTAHSALVLRNAQYYLLHLLNDPEFRFHVDRPELEATLILALLHDIGHYTLSHLFDDYASEQKYWKKPGRPATQWSQVNFDIPSGDDLFISAYDHLSLDKKTANCRPGDSRGHDETMKLAYRASPQGSKAEQNTMGWLTDRHFGPETYNAVVAIHESVYLGKEKPPCSHTILGGILSSSLDADRISRLMINTNETGAQHCLGIELDRLLGTLRSPAPADIKSAHGPLLAILKMGTSAAESLLATQNIIHERVYEDPTNRAVIAMAKYSITRLLKAGALHFPEFLEKIFFAPYGTALHALRQQYENQFGPTRQNPIKYALDGKKSAHQEFSILSTENGSMIAKYLLHRTVFGVAAIEDDLTSTAATDCNMKQVNPGDILLDAPVHDPDRPNGERHGSVLVYEDETNDSGTPLETVTPTSQALFETNQIRNRTCRFYVSRKLLETLDENQKEKLKMHVRNFLGSKVSEPHPSPEER